MRRAPFIALFALAGLATSCSHNSNKPEHATLSDIHDFDMRGEYGYDDTLESQKETKPVLDDTRNRSLAQTKPANGPRLRDYKPYNYELLFTDPECGPYEYSKPVRSVGGKELAQKPSNVYCFNRLDQKKSGARPQSPQYRLVEWISDPKVTQIKFTYLSFSNKTVKNALCEAAKRGVKIRFTIDTTSDRTAADELAACSTENVMYTTRGNEGEIGYGHNKIMMFFYGTTPETRIVFSSGNMSSGPVLHHENWHFITTSQKSHFAHMHNCALDSMWDEKTGRNRATYLEAIRSCRANAPAREESDIKAFFVPGEGVDYDNPALGASATRWMIMGENGFPGIRTASKIWIGCHRFMYPRMIKELTARMQGPNKPEMQIVCDDDTYYKAMDKSFAGGDTLPDEWHNMDGLRKLGANVKMMETNENDHQLHHSKYLLFADQSGDFKSVLAGAANLTASGFSKNYENIYYIMIPEVVQNFAAHHKMMFETMATHIEDLPVRARVCNDINLAKNNASNSELCKGH